MPHRFCGIVPEQERSRPDAASESVDPAGHQRTAGQRRWSADIGDHPQEELNCANDVDLICAFVGWTGVSQLLDESSPSSLEAVACAW